MSFASPEEAAAWLAGFFDGEGTVSVNRHCRRLSIANTDVELVDRCVEAMGLLDIRCRVHTRSGKARPSHWAQGYDIAVYGCSELRRFSESVPFQCSKKRKKLDAMLGTFQFRYMTRDRIPADELRRLYWDEDYSCQMLAEHFGVGISTVFRWMTFAEVPRRTNSASTTLAWQRRKAA